MKKQLASFALVLALVAGTAPGVLADEEHDAYLALGDSIPFGFSPLVMPAQRANPSIFVGYPEAFGAMHELTLTNLSCPGETSGSMISTPTPANPDLGCQRYRSRFPLHTSYAGPQLGFALAYLQSHTNVGMISISIGRNDMTLLAKACNNDAACELAGLPALQTRLGQNLRTIYAAIRGTGYEGQLVAVTYYAVKYGDATEVQLISAVNRAMAQVTREFDGDVADGFRAFREGAEGFNGDSCAAGLLIVVSASPLGCDLHPSPAGRDVLAAAIEE